MTYIGIDPDLIKSGVAFWRSKPELLEVQTLEFFDLLSYIGSVYVRDPSTMVFLEAGWKNEKSNFHGGATSNIRERIAKNVGENHAVGKLIEQFLIRWKIPYHLVTPSTKKWNAAEFKVYTGNKTRTNSEMRDAAKLVFGRT